MLHVSHLRENVHDPSLVVETSVQDDLEIEPNLTIIRHLVGIVDQDEKKLHNEVMQLVKIQWSDDPRDCTGETVDHVKEAYPRWMLYVSWIYCCLGCLYTFCMNFME